MTETTTDDLRPALEQLRDQQQEITRLRRLAREFGDERDTLRQAAMEAHDNGDVGEMRAILKKALS